MKSKKTHPILTVILVFIIITIIALVCVLVIGLRNRAVNKAGSPATPVQNPYQWVKEPCLDYDWMHYTDGEYSGWWLDSYMIAQKGDEWATLDFEGVIVQPFTNDLGTYQFWLGYMEAGRSKGIFWMQNPDTGDFRLFSFVSDGPGSPIEGVDDPYWGEYYQDYYNNVALYIIANPDLAEDFSNYEENFYGQPEDVPDILDRPYGLVKQGQMLLEPEYQNFHKGEGAIALRKGNKWAYYSYDETRFITEFEYDIFRDYTYEVFPDAGPFDGEGPAFVIGSFYEGLCPVKEDGKYGYIDIEGNQVTPMEFDGATNVQGGKAWVKMDGLWGQIEFTAGGDD